ncbi:MAG TPA: hypothetical protein VGT08_06695 [Terracidiphilus sp.]|nr:hypothetical protein [Terracidiphilus sp.]
MPQVLLNSRIESRASNGIRIFDAPTPLRLWHLASLDAPSVALVWSLAFAWVARVRLPLWVPALLALAVWAVYVADRLLDARAGLRATNCLRDRHLFHWRHRRVLLPLAIAAASAAAWIIFNLMPLGARERNSLLAAASLVYFTRVHTGRKVSPLLSPILSKELLVGLLFTAGCALPAWSRAALPHHALLWPPLIPAVFFALLAWLNCHAIDRWEASPDPTSQLPIFSQASLIALAGLLLAAILSVQPRTTALLIAGAAAALLIALLDSLRSRLTPIALRTAADLVLLTPLLLVPFTQILK